MPLAMEVGLGPGHIVLGGDPVPIPPTERGTAAPTFRPAHVYCGQNGRPSQELLSSRLLCTHFHSRTIGLES